MRCDERSTVQLRRLGFRLTSGLTAATLVLGAPASAQTRFAWPDTTVDVSRYTTIEECQAAVSRVRQGAVSHEQMVSGIWRDTMPPNPREGSEPLPSSVGETARRCFARFSAVDSVPLTYFDVLLPHYLMAGWDEKARALVDRRLAGVAPSAQNELAAVIDSVVRLYSWGTGTRRLAMAEQIMATYSPRVSDRTRRLRSYLSLMLLTASEWRTDTVRAQRILRRAVAIADSLTDQERASLKDAKLVAVDLAIDEVGSLEEQLYAVLNEAVGRGTFLDSLRRSTAAFVALKRQNWVRVTRRPPAAFQGPIGQRAPAIQADFWLGGWSSSSPRPTPGRVSLVTFVNRSANSSYTEYLFPLRRLAQRFPQLEITVVAQSHGHFMSLKDSITPAKEAELTKQWLESFGVQAALAMTSTDYWRLSQHDRRRIDRAVANRTNYSFGKSWPMGYMGGTFLVDAEGIVVHASAGLMSRSDENDVGDMIEVLLARRGTVVTAPRM